MTLQMNITEWTTADALIQGRIPAEVIVAETANDDDAIDLYDDADAFIFH